MDMMWDKLQLYFKGRNLNAVDLHMEGMSLFYTDADTSANLVCIVSTEKVAELTAEQYHRYTDKIRRNFYEKGYTMVTLMNLFLTSSISKAKELGENEMFWIVDESYGRLVVYENQPEDYMGLRSMIEGNLRFGNHGLNQEAKAQAEADIQGMEQRRKEAYIRKTKSQKRYQRAHFWRNLPNYSLVLYTLIGLNLIIFLITDLFGVQSWLTLGSLNWQGVVEDKQVYRILTSMFLHADIGHIGSNMLVLFGVGDLLEQRIDHKRFLLLYMLSGLGAAICSLWYYHMIGEEAYSIGASGAIYGVVGAMLVLVFTDARYRGRNFAVRAGIVACYLFYTLFAAGGNVDNAAHCGGLITGSLVFLVMQLIERRKRTF